MKKLGPTEVPQSAQIESEEGMSAKSIDDAIVEAELYFPPGD